MVNLQTPYTCGEYFLDPLRFVLDMIATFAAIHRGDPACCVSSLNIGDGFGLHDIVTLQEIIQDGDLPPEFDPGLTGFEWSHHSRSLRRHSEYRRIDDRAEKTSPHLPFMHSRDSRRKYVVATIRPGIRRSWNIFHREQRRVHVHVERKAIS